MGLNTSLINIQTYNIIMYIRTAEIKEITNLSLGLKRHVDLYKYLIHWRGKKKIFSNTG